MKLAPVAAAAFLVVTSGSAFSQGTTWTFDDLPAGRPPPGFVFASAPDEQAQRWLVLRDDSNAFLGHVQPGLPGTQLAIAGTTSFADLMLSARVRFAEGARSAGLVWRYRNPDNYYLMALDLRAQDVRVYRVVGGNRTRLDDESDLELDPGIWHTLKVEDRGMRIRVWINGVPVAGGRDRTSREPGAIGVWTRGDSVAWFDDLRVEPINEPERSNRRN